MEIMDMRSTIQRVVVTTTVFAGLAMPVLGQVTSRVSVASSGAQGNLGSGGCSLSADGRYVVFSSAATNLIPSDLNSDSDTFLRDCQSGLIERVSVSSSGAAGNDASLSGAVSADGRYVAFNSSATNLVPGDTNGRIDVFVRDRQTGLTERVSVSSSGAQGNDFSSFASMSDDGRYVAFGGESSTLVIGDTNGVEDVFVRDRQTGLTERVSVDSSGVQGNGISNSLQISADGRYVAFSSDATNLVPGDTNGRTDSFVRDRQTGLTERVSVDSSGAEADGNSYGGSPSADGRYVAFVSAATDLVGGDTNGKNDVFVRDRLLGVTERVSVDSSGTQANDHGGEATISSDGRYVTFNSTASNLVPGDTNFTRDIFLRDRLLGVTERISVNSSGSQGLGESGNYGLSISADGRYVAFASAASNLVPGDTNANRDVFVRNREYAPFTSSCDPGTGGVIACPCANAPSGSGRGCDNSAATGGASLSATGIAYLTMDSLVFTTVGEKPTATSVLLQGTTSPAAGITYGQGVRCVGGTLKRLFTKSAVGGSITAPNFGAGDPTVSARSSAKGNPISAGQSRWYLVFYRDPIVLGGCPVTSTFNATQTGKVDWSL